MAKETLDIEDLSQMLQLAGSQPRISSGRQLRSSRPCGALRDEAAQFAPEDLSIPIIVEEPPEDELDTTITIVDSLTTEERETYRCAEGRYLRYRIGVLGIGEAVEQVYHRLRQMLGDATDPLVEHLNLWVRYQVALFGGKPRDGVVERADAALLADRLALFKPSFLVLVNAGPVKNRFADKTPQQLAIITHHINQGALVGGQRPYTVVLVTDYPVPAERFAEYQRLCRTTMNTFPAERQFAPEETGALLAYARSTLQAYTEQHLTERHR